MEDIQSKAHDDELNKGCEEIGEEPRKYTPVPKTKKEKRDEKRETEKA